MKAFVYSKNQVSIALSDIIKRWPRESGAKNLMRHNNVSLNPMISCVSMLAHPIDEDTGDLMTKRILEIMCIDPGYTVYQKCYSREEGAETWNLADTDSYDLESDVMGTLEERCEYKTVTVKPVTFANEKEAHDVVASDMLKVLSGVKNDCDWLDNHHGIIDEFVLKTSLMPCARCETGLSGKRFLSNNEPICRKCRPTKRFEGVNVKTPKIIDLAKLSSSSSTTARVFTKERMVDSEYVTFMSPETLPFIKGQEALDDKYSSQFLQKSKSVVYDIETVTVNETLKKKIPDEIVTITASVNVGTTTNKLVMFTRKVPAEWEGCDSIDPNELLGDLLRKPVQPTMRVIVCHDESSLVATFRDFLLTYRPHFLVSYNGHGFDNKFLIRASVANGHKETFHGALNHFTPLVKINNKDPLKDVDPRQFLRPYGQHCKGLISSSVMEVGYDSFPCMVSVDLFPIHDTSLNDACSTKKVDGCKLEGVAHTDIPRLYYGRHVDFFKYALLDVVITTELFWKDRFDAVDLFMELEELVSTPWNLSVSRQKTVTALTTSYVQFHTNGFLRRGKLRPNRVQAGAIVDDLAECLHDRTAKPKMDETMQLIVDFTNSHCKCNTLYKKLPPMPEGPLTEETVRKVLAAQTKLKKPTDPPYSTVDALMLLFYLFRGDIDWRPFSGLLEEFSSVVKRCPKKMTGLKNFCEYVVQVRRCMSPVSETAKLMWKEYKKNHKTDTVIAAALENFVKTKYNELMAAAKESREYPRTLARDLTAKKVATMIKNANDGKGGIKLKFLPYDGAMIIFHGAKINFNNPVCVLDFQSQYPNGMRAINLGVDTNVSLDKVMRCIRKLQLKRNLPSREEAARVLAEEFVHVCFTREEDDQVDWTKFLDSPEYLSRNCIFFVRNVTSIQNHQFKAEIDSRVVDKLKAEDSSLPSEVRKRHLNKSTAKKVNINSRYGVIQKVMNPRFQATVTGVGRRSIQRVTKQLKELVGAEEIYGDTDSCFTFLPTMNVFDMVGMSAREMYDEFKFGLFGTMTFEDFETSVYAKHYPVADENDPRAIRNAGGGIAQDLYQLIAPALSTPALKLDAEKKSLCPLTLPSMKKYTAYNCATKKPLTKGLSMHNRSAIPLTKTILEEYVNLCASCWDEFDLACKLYDYLGKRVAIPVDLGLVDPKSIAKPCTINLKKVRPGSKQKTMIERMLKGGQTFIFEKLHIKQVPVYPHRNKEKELEDKDWSLCDINTQSCEGREHAVKIKFDCLKEILTILRGYFNQAICEIFEALIWGEFYPDRFTPEDFKKMAATSDCCYKPASFSKVMKRFREGLWRHEP